MKKLFGMLRREHRADIDALSAYLDGALGAAQARELEDHLAGCEACAGEVTAMRRVKTMLAAMPQAEAPRSFRLRLADIEKRAGAVPAPPAGLMRALPVLSAAAAFIFVAVLATDFATRDGGGGSQLAASRSSDDAASGPMKAIEDSAGAGATESENDRQLYQTSPADGAETPAVAAAPSLSTVEGTPAAADVPPEADSTGGEGGIAGPDTAPNVVPGTTACDAGMDNNTCAMDTLEAARAEDAGDDDGNRTAFRIVEVLAAVVALGAGAAFVVRRVNRNEGQP